MRKSGAVFARSVTLVAPRQVWYKVCIASSCVIVRLVANCAALKPSTASNTINTGKRQPV